MRIAPMVVPYAAAPSAALWVDTALSAMTTHNDSAAIGSAVAFVSILGDVLAMNMPPPPRWWVDSFVSVLRDLETGSYSARGGRLASFTGRFSDFVEQRVLDALERKLAARDACDEWYSGAYLLETLPSVLYILARHAHDPEEAIARAVNDTCDNDTIAAIVGAAVGALHGHDALPERWRHGLLGRTGASDDGRVFELIGQARTVFWPDGREPRSDG
jgi:ADP-ribosylglycohydrolase